MPTRYKAQLRLKDWANDRHAVDDARGRGALALSHEGIEILIAEDGNICRLTLKLLRQHGYDNLYIVGRPGCTDGADGVDGISALMQPVFAEIVMNSLENLLREPFLRPPLMSAPKKQHEPQGVHIGHAVAELLSPLAATEDHGRAGRFRPAVNK